jgi:hypothetical protein
MLKSVEATNEPGPAALILRRMKEEKRKALKLLRRPINPTNSLLFSNCRLDSDPPPQGTTLDVGPEVYRPSQEAS